MSPATVSSTNNSPSPSSTPTPTQTSVVHPAKDSNNGPSFTGPDTSVLISILQRHVLNTLDGLTGGKTLVLGHDIAGILGLAIEINTLRQHGVDKLYYLEPGAAHSQGWARNVVYVCHAQVSLMKIIASQVSKAPSHHSHTILISPNLTSTCRSTLQDEGILGSIDIRELPSGFIPLEPDLLSIERPRSYRSLFFEGDYGPVYEMAQSLITFQRAFGLIPRIIGKGTNAQRLANTLEQLKKELPAKSKNVPLQQGHVDSMVILDRSVDMVTPLCTQLTYTGLVDEYIGIHNAHVEVETNTNANNNPNQSPSSSTSSSFTQAPKKRKHHLNTSNDPLYAELCNSNFAIVSNILNRVARRISTDYESRHMARTPSQLRDFAGRLGGLQADHNSLKLHTGLTEEIMKFTNSDPFDRTLEIQQNLVAGIDVPQQETIIKTLLNEEISARSVLKLMCLYSQVNGGIKPKVLEEFKRDFLQTYGYDYLSLLVSLSAPNVNLLTKSTGVKSPFSVARKPFRLIVDDVDEQNPNDMSYVYSGYAPLLVRLVQGAIEERKGGQPGVVNGWRGLEDAVRPLPGGPLFEKFENIDPNHTGKLPTMPPITLVCILGGLTYAEVSALRWLSKKQPERRLIICTTDMINGTSLLSDLSVIPV